MGVGSNSSNGKNKAKSPFSFGAVVTDNADVPGQFPLESYSLYSEEISGFCSDCS